MKAVQNGVVVETNKTYSHAFTIAFEVLSDDPEEPTLNEWMAGLRHRVRIIESSPIEAEAAFRGDGPYDSYKITEEEEA
jgi:hypothetical protein